MASMPPRNLEATALLRPSDGRLARWGLLGLVAALTLLLASQAWAQSGTAVINDLSVTTGVVGGGQAVTVLMHATPGGRATFDLGNHIGIPMTEGPSGTYRGTYTVTTGDDTLNAPMIAHLAMADGMVASISAPSQVWLLGHWRSSTNIIASVAHNAQGDLHPGQILTVTMVGVPSGVATFDLGTHMGLPMAETSPGNYNGTFTVGVGDVQPAAKLTVHLDMPDGREASVVAPASLAVLGLP
jgi:hypothetical protein